MYVIVKEALPEKEALPGNAELYPDAGGEIKRMEWKQIILGHWLEIAIALYLLGMILYGHYKGFIRLSVSALAMVITFTTIHLAMPHITSWVKNETLIYEQIRGGVEKAAGLDELSDLTMDHEAENKVIEALGLPQKIRKALEDNNTGETYRIMGVTLFRDYVSGYLADMILKMAVFVVLFLTIYIILHLLVLWLDLIARLPILSGINKISGALLGAAEALIFIWIGCLLLTAFSGTAPAAAALKQVEASKWLSYLYDHNLLLNFVVGLVCIAI